MSSVADRQDALSGSYPVWQPRTLDAMLDHAAACWPDRDFFVGEDGSFTYAQMAGWSRRIAAGLIDMELRPGEHVAVIVANYPAFAALKFAIARAGGVAVPINVLNRRDELAYLIRQSDSVLLVTMDRFRDLDYLQALDDLMPGWETSGGGASFPALRKVIVLTVEGDGRSSATSFAALEERGVYDGPSRADPADNADIIYTSGTTGDPKGVQLTHDMLLRTAYAAAYARAFEDGRRIAFTLPMYHVFGYVEGLLPVLFVGGAAIVSPRFEARDMLQGIVRHRATDILAVPTMTLALVEAQRALGLDLSATRSILSSGTRSPERVWAEIGKVLGIDEVTTGYGMTEVTASSTVTRPGDPVERWSTNGRLRDAAAAGDPDLGGRLIVYRVVDPESDAELPTGSVGELRAKGPGVTAGYYNKPVETAAAFDDDGWLRTGDLGHIDNDGYVILSGRLKESYRCGGEQVLPSEIEDVLTSLADVEQAHIVSVPDDRMGEIGVAFVVLRPGSHLTAQDLVTMTQERVARFKVPRHVFQVDADTIPMTASGRARKFMLREKAIELIARA